MDLSLFPHNFMPLLQRIESILLSFLLIGFIVAILFSSNQENLDMIHYDKDLFYDIYNTITEHNQK